MNIIVSDSVKGKVTIKLDNVPWDEVLDIILETNNLGKVWTKSVMRIETQEQIRSISDEQYKAQKSLEKVADLETVVVDIIYRDAQDIHTCCRRKENSPVSVGHYTVDPNLNRIVITDTADKIEAIRNRISVMMIRQFARYLLMRRSFSLFLPTPKKLVSSGVAPILLPQTGIPLLVLPVLRGLSLNGQKLLILRQGW